MVSLPGCAQGALVLAAVAAAGAHLPPIPSDLTTPVQQRIAVDGPNSAVVVGTGIAVSWNTYEKLDQACVKYGAPDCSSLTEQVCSSTPGTTYPSSRTWFNSVTLTGLRPATKYCYQIVSTNSTKATFLSPRQAGDKTPFSINAVIDLGVYGEDGYTIQMKQDKRDEIPSIPPSLNHTTIKRLADTIDDYEFVIHPGDLAYADDWALKGHNLLDGKKAFQAILEQFYDQLAPISSRKPYMASPGNHEAVCEEIPLTSGLCPDGQKNFTDFMTRFGSSMPASFASTSPDAAARVSANRARQLARPPFWFSFEYGMAHVVMLDTETDFASAPDGPGGSAGLDSGPFGSPGQQLDFLAADLASVDRSVTPWLIAAGHRPWYTTGDQASDPCEPCRAAFEGLLYRYGVDLAVFGHVHNSQRFMPVVNGTADPAGLDNPRAPMYIVAGGAGNVEGLSAVGTRPAYTAFAYADDFSYATIRFVDPQNLRVDFYRSSTGELLDSSTLRKAHDRRFVRQ
ncbi:Purple acid phosphatase-lik [Metarhizium album ARSEF 1941]|uniref:Purple acid phosphatase n=1 Tax=Metarhizium album (strain ARSEF 1941) TaxID=1081103 RepID=A0A0B2WR91_METAS|nr:Purple acid phosphatase-lik [Metarhizium album ARSEF 1941]KHN96134.1 Purple acid phosphatase-lik [Metarhizium album ARSEF 1941]